MDIEDIKLKEIKIFIEVLKAGSVRAVARDSNLAAGQVSKLISSLERKVGFKLIDRSSFGVSPTAKAMELWPLFNEIQENQESLRSNFVTTKEKEVLSFASNFFLGSHLLPQVCAAFEKNYKEQRLRLLDLAPDSFLPVAMRNGFQICLHSRDHDWPKTWTSEKVGDLHWILCGRKNHPVLQKTQLREVLKYPFIFPVYWTMEGLKFGNDSFPLTDAKRIRGCETATAVAALEIMRRTDQLGFVPEIVARPYLNSGEIEQIELSTLKTVKQPVYLTVKNDVISQKMFAWLIKTCQQEMAF